jgi:hypothetical protein
VDTAVKRQPPFRANPYPQASLAHESEDIDMKRTILVLLCLAAFVLFLTSCNEQKESLYSEVTQYIGPADTTAPATKVPPADEPAAEPETVDNTGADFTEEDILNEEAANPILDINNNATVDPGYAAQTNLFSYNSQNTANATAYPYTGSSPIPLEPIDAPTPTPQAPLNFTYISYSPASVGLSFEAPAGWVADDTYNEVFTLTEPESQMKSGQLGIINIYAVPVTDNYSEAQLVQEIKQRLNTIGSLNFTEWRPSLTATRYLMGSKGVYANYYGTLVTGVKVGGRIHAATIDNVLYCIQITYPLDFKEDFMDVFAQLRETIKRTNR